MMGAAPDSFDAGEWRTLARLARASYAARMLGSAWAALMRVR
jgi:hypothetical protein